MRPWLLVLFCNDAGHYAAGQHVRCTVKPGALFFDGEGRLISVMSLDVADGQIQGVSSIANPDKLRHLGPLADLEALLGNRS
jgi:hypothetical protein